MHTLEVLQALPARLRWLVFFRLDSIARFAEPDVIKRMFFLRSDTGLSLYSHVVLTSEGRYLCQAHGAKLDAAGDESTPLKRDHEESMLARYTNQLRGLPLEDADCIGVGHGPDSQPAFLHVKLGVTSGEATALLRQEPTQRHYELLPVIGVEYLGGEMTPAGYTARFRNRLATHIKAGMLSGFTRTENCNLFFIEHAEINDPLALGLRSAFSDRLTSGRQIIKTFLHKLAVKAMESPLAMTCIPPLPQCAFPYGDLVPLGFLVRGIRAITQSQPAPALLLQVHEDLAIKKLVRFVDDAKSDGLWAFHRGRLVTATDSALVLLGVVQSVPCEALEAFTDGQGAYYPQLSADEDVRGKMESDFSNAHWRQADFATTCLIRGLRTESQLPAKTPPSVIAAGFDRRSGLFFANPYLVDWCTALALKNDSALAHLQERLLEEILSSANPDGSYGQYDVGLSTGLAILCMESLGYRGPALRLAQIRLLNLLDAGPWPISTPFYSTFMQPQDTTPTSEHISCQGTLHARSLYRDGYRIVFSGVTGMALAVDSAVTDNEAPIPRADPHPRYRCTDLTDYVARFALPPYIESLHGASRPDSLAH
jgi:hypothetical protein